MPTRTTTSYLLAAWFLVFGVGSGFAQCPDETLQVAIDSPPVQGHGTLVISEGSVVLELDLTEPCETHITALGVATADTIQINNGGVSLIGFCGSSTFEISLTDPCETGDNFENIPVATGTTGQGDDDDDDDTEPGDDDDDDDNGTGGTSAQPLDVRSGKGGTRPEAKLIGIEVEVNPSVVKIDDIGASRRLNSNQVIDDVTFTARLVFSDGAIPKEFKHKTGAWQFWPVVGGEAQEGRVNESSWVDSMKANANLDFSLAWVPGLNDLDKERQLRDLEPIEVDQQSINVMFKMLPAEGVGGNRVKSQKIPVKVVYLPLDEDNNEEFRFSKTVNIQVERKASSGAFAGSSGPASRIVTYSRVLE